MNAWTYYSPLWLGALLVLALNDTIRGSMTYSDAKEWIIVAAYAISTGILCQGLLIGAQGAFAQVLPVPVGRSLRGGSAASAGWLLILAILLTGVTVLFAHEGAALAAKIAGALGLGALLGAAIIYTWNIPTAVADFGRERLR